MEKSLKSNTEFDFADFEVNTFEISDLAYGFVHRDEQVYSR